MGGFIRFPNLSWGKAPKELLVEPDIVRASIVTKRTHASALPQ